jgi:hypothetical protein
MQIKAGFREFGTNLIKLKSNVFFAYSNSFLDKRLSDFNSNMCSCFNRIG